MAGMDWFRWHHGAVSDPKFQLVAKKAGASVAEVIAVWATLLEEASQSDDRGNYGALDFEAIDCALGLSDGKAQAIHALMAVRQLVDIETTSITAWDKRQPKREREDNTNAERQRAYKAKHAQVTPSNATVTPDNTEKHLEERRGEESREEEIQEAHVALDGNARDKPGEVCKAMKDAGMASVNPSNLKLVAMLESGVTKAELVQAAIESVAIGKGFGYALGMASGRRADAVAAPKSRASPQNLSFAERDRIAAMQRWEVDCNRKHPDLPDEYSKFPATGAVIDIDSKALRIAK